MLLFLIIGLAAIFRFRYQFTISDDRVIMRLGLIAKNTNEYGDKAYKKYECKTESIGKTSAPLR